MSVIDMAKREAVTGSGATGRTMMIRVVALSLCGLAMLSPTRGLCATPKLEFNNDTAKKFFNDKGCNGCHGRDEMRIGPPYQVVSMRYGAEPRSERVLILATKIRHGGAGAWGIVPMPSNPGVSPTEAEAIARWILDLKPAEAATPSAAGTAQ